MIKLLKKHIDYYNYIFKLKDEHFNLYNQIKEMLQVNDKIEVIYCNEKEIDSKYKEFKKSLDRTGVPKLGSVTRIGVPKFSGNCYLIPYSIYELKDNCESEYEKIEKEFGKLAEVIKENEIEFKKSNNGIIDRMVSNLILNFI